MIPETLYISKLHGEGDTTLTDKRKRRTRKLSREILGLLAVTLIISVVIFWLLFACGITIIEHICASRDVILTDAQLQEVDNWTYNVSLLISVAFFVVALLFLMGDRLSYALNKIEDKERALSQEKEQLFRSLSHDIRTPLTSILSYSEFLLQKEGSSPEEYKEYLELIRKKGQQIKDLTDVLLEGGKRDLQTFEDGKLLMEQLAAEFEAALEDRYPVKTDLSSCKSFKGDFDINELMRIFDNLITNVQKYADPEKEVSLKISASKNEISIVQSNSITPQPAEVESNKIGLASIKRIAHHYGGQVEVVSDTDEFQISITLSEF